MQHWTTRRAKLGIAALASLAAAFTLYACSVSGHASGTTEFRPPFVDPITITFTIGNDGSTGCSINGGPQHANKCVQITWSDAAGNTVGTTTIQTDGSGAASGQVPPGSVRWQVDVVDCPEPVTEDDSSRDNGEGAFDPVRISQGPDGVQGRKLASLSIREHLIQGGPIVPTASGDLNLTYCFVVKAGGFAEAKAFVDPIVAGGIGTPVPPSVKVIAFATMQADVFGGRYVQAQPGQFQSWSLDFNQGAFQADHHTALNYQLNGWDVMETAIPLAAFDFGGALGTTYSNSGVASYSTNLLAAPVTGSYSYSFSN